VNGLKQLFQLPRREQPFSAYLLRQNGKQVRLCGLVDRKPDHESAKGRNELLRFLERVLGAVFGVARPQGRKMTGTPPFAALPAVLRSCGLAALL
jgi:hypothetical protein